MQIVNLNKEFRGVKEHWQLKSLGQFNNHSVKIIKFSGEFQWHSHNCEKLFMVIRGTLKLETRDGTHFVNEGEFITVPSGTEVKPASASEELWLMIIEPSSQTFEGAQ